ncbi:MAG TPA: glycosyltransferase, partial [Paracoccaceae bacterium]|nr:glycosyltransferase [Paracoccaceae bacterium]
MLYEVVHLPGAPLFCALPCGPAVEDDEPDAMPPAICIVLPVYRPDPAHLRAQMASLAAQTLRDHLTIVVVADGASAELARQAAADCGLRAEVQDPGQTLDAPRAFEAGLARALVLAGPETRIALCDQDDIWHPDRLERGLAAMDRTGAALVHSDARLVDATGAPLHRSMFRFEGRHR